MSRPTPSPRTATPDDRGSVLIFVVGVLLLLAIIATAFLGSSRADRTSTQQNAYNTQIDLLMEGVGNAIKGAILADARFNADASPFDSLTGDMFLASRTPSLSVLTPFTNYQANLAAGPGYNPPMWTFITSPLLESTFSYPMSAGSIGATRSTYTSRQGLIPSSITYKGKPLPAFLINENDERLAGDPLKYPQGGYVTSATAVPAIDADNDGIADSGMVRVPVGPIGGVTYYYGARVVDLNSAINFNTASGWNDNWDGVSDPANSWAVWAPGTVPGNFSPANVDLIRAITGNPAVRGDQYSLRARTSLNALRFGQANDPATTYTASAYTDGDPPVTPPTAGNDLRTDYIFSNVGDMLWSQLGRRVDNPGYINRNGDVVRRMAKLDINNSVGLARRFILQDSTTGAMSKAETALDFSLTGETVTGTAPFAVTVRSEPYDVTDSLNWFNNTFAFFPGNPANQQMPLRSLLTGTNPTGGDVPPPVTSVPTAAPYVYGNVVKVAGRSFMCIAPFTNTSPADAVAVGTIPPYLGAWTLLSWIDTPRKTDLNTAEFGELYATFRRMMTDTVPSTIQPAAQFAAASPFPIDAGATGTYTTGEQEKWRQYRNVIRDPMAIDPIVTSNPRTNLNAAVGAGPAEAIPRFMSSSEVLQMRAALAAVNTLDIRDEDDNITARRIRTAIYPTTPGGTIVERHAVTVFGTERQPFITEVYVNTDTTTTDGGNTTTGTPGPVGVNPRGYVAIELYNPYPTPMNLNGWTLGLINRRRGAANPPANVPGKAPGQPLRMNPILQTAQFASTRFENAIDNFIIPPNGYLILENFKDPENTAYDTDPAVANPLYDAAHRPQGAQSIVTALALEIASAPVRRVRFKFISGLSLVLNDTTVGTPTVPNGGELVLLRPRVHNLLTGAYTPTVQPLDPVDPCDEGTIAAPNLYDHVPIDSFDFTNMNAVAASPTFNVYHYARENGGVGPQFWKHAMARRYVVTGAPSTAAPQTIPRQGAASLAVAPAAVDPVIAGDSPVQLGLIGGTAGSVDVSGSQIESHQGVQLNSTGWPGPRPKVTFGGNTYNLFPAGSFSRETDIFMVPNIGAYKIMTLAAPTVTSADGLIMPAVAAAAADRQAEPPSPADAPYFTEMNSVAMDHSFADDEDYPYAAPPATGSPQTIVAGANDALEQVGRLCPLHTLVPNGLYLNYPITNAAPAASKPPSIIDGQYQTVLESLVDWYDPNFNFTTGLAKETGLRSVFDFFTTKTYDNALPPVGPDEYVSTYTGVASYLPMASNPSSNTRPAGSSYMVVASGSGKVIGGAAPNAHTLYRLVNPGNLPRDVRYDGCTIQVLTGAARGRIAPIESDDGLELTINAALPGVPGIAAGDIVRILSATDTPVIDQGLININTAPWYVLARLPMVLTPNSGVVDPIPNSDLAKRIVLYRDGDPAGATAYQRRPHGPFKSILDLNRVLDGATSAFQTADGTIDAMTMNDRTAGDITPLYMTDPATGNLMTTTTGGVTTYNNGAPESVADDFERKYLALSRIANMITTRSDGFVVYINLQGWRDAGTANATLVTQRRAAFIIDRSGATVKSPTLSTTRVPNNN